MLIDIELKSIDGMLKTRKVNATGFRKDDSDGWRVELCIGGRMTGIVFPNKDNRDAAFNLLNDATGVVTIPVELFWPLPESEVIQLPSFRYLKKAISLASSVSGRHPTTLDALAGLPAELKMSLIKGIKPAVDIKHLARIFARTLATPKEFSNPFIFYSHLL